MTEQLVRGVEWLDNHLDLFLPDPEGATYDRQLLQRAGELALLYRALHDSGFGPAAALGRFRSALTAYVNSEEVIEASRRSLDSAWAWLMPYFVLKTVHGLQNDEHERTLELALAIGLPGATEVVPYRKLDQRYFLALREGRRLQAEDGIGDTFFAKFLSLTNMSREAVYSITHTLFYLSDFGRNELVLEGEGGVKLIALLDSLLMQYTRLQDWDVLGELLIVAYRTRGFDRSLADEYMGYFQSLQAPSGYTPPSAQTRDALEVRTDRSSIFDACYHTTLVAALLEVARARPKGQVTESGLVLAGLQPLRPVDEAGLLRDLVEGRNRAVAYFNERSAQGQSVVVAREEEDTPALAPQDLVGWALADRRTLLQALSGEVPALVRRHALPLAECYAREDDLEVVLKLIETCLSQHACCARMGGLFHFLHCAQKPDGSIGYFARVERVLGQPNVEPARNALTLGYVQATEAFLMPRLA